MKKLTLTTIGALASLALLAGCSAPTTASATPEAAAPSTPTSCLDALDDAEKLDGLMGDALDSAARAIEAAVSWDDATLDDETAYLETLTPQVHETRASFDSNAASCRGGAS